ncbi:B-type cell cycle switch protein ccs52A-like isoform X5 [Malus domestica]|uniref:B-type cell cycle switch protein ccs52A-like isoform X5 n=1 Tax=Malus domestica TaxID=3750 RepID=UPI00397566FA
MPAVFEPDSAGIIHPATPEKRSVIQMNPLSPNIFRFKTETRRSMHSLSPFGFHDVVIGVHHCPVKAPQKVLDATTLQDDLYSNFVDWSSHNVLVVGLGNFVYLWNVCSSKLTKLCDLGIDDSVCSVFWG